MGCENILTIYFVGDPEGSGMGGLGYGIKGEFAQNGVSNDLKHTEGVLSMARSMHPDNTVENQAVIKISVD